MNIFAKTLAIGTLAVTAVTIAIPAQAQNMRGERDYYSYESHEAYYEYPARSSGSWQSPRNEIRERYNGGSQSTDGNGYIFN